MYRGNEVTGVIQARMGSTRLPNKVLMELAGRPVIWHVIERLKSVEGLDEIIVATSTKACDDLLADYIEQLDEPGVDIFRGPEQDVLKRFYLALEKSPTDLVVRVTGDSPLVCPHHLQKMLHHIVEHRLDGVDAHREKTGLTLGLGSEVYHHQALVDAHLLSACPVEREHVSLFIKRRPRAFRVEYPAPERELCSDYRLTLDYPDDYRLLRTIYQEMYRPGCIVDCRRVLDWLRSRPQVAQVNADCIQKSP